MCSCGQSLVHVYQHRISFLENVLGEPQLRLLNERLGLAGPGRYEIICPACPSGYLWSMFALGIPFLLGVVIALAAGWVLPARWRLAAMLVLAWAALVAGRMHGEYARRVDWAHRMPRDPDIIGFLNDYGWALSAQFLFNAVVALILPMLAGYWFAYMGRRFRQR